MKRILLLTLALLSVTLIYAQGIKDGAYILEKTVTYEGMTKQQIFTKSLVSIGLNGGSKFLSSSSVEVSDKEEGIILCKNVIYLGFYKQNMMAGWDVTSPVSLLIRIKDGKAHYQLMSTAITFMWTGTADAPHTFPVDQIYPEYTLKSDYRVDKAGKELSKTLPTFYDAYINAIIELTKTPDPTF